MILNSAILRLKRTTNWFDFNRIPPHFHDLKRTKYVKKVTQYFTSQIQHMCILYLCVHDVRSMIFQLLKKKFQFQFL